MLTKSINLVVCLVIMCDNYFLPVWRKDRLQTESQMASWGRFSIIFQSGFDSSQFNVNETMSLLASCNEFSSKVVLVPTIGYIYNFLLAVCQMKGFFTFIIKQTKSFAQRGLKKLKSAHFKHGNENIMSLGQSNTIENCPGLGCLNNLVVFFKNLFKKNCFIGFVLSSFS